MKKLIVSAIAVLTGVLSAIGCGNHNAFDAPATVSQISAYSCKNTIYTIHDIRNMQDFLLARPTEEDLSNKNYDLNDDGVWNVFDLCLMKRKIIQAKEKEVGVFDMESKTVLLNSGYEMPILGLGTYSLLDDICVNSVVAELQSGGRLIDTAYMYHNEESVGEGIRQSGIPDDEAPLGLKSRKNSVLTAFAGFR